MDRTPPVPVSPLLGIPIPYVENSAADAPFLRAAQKLFLDDRPARHIDDHSSRAHCGKGR
jgi:hypothetical protein